jgi:hypothetical protein
MLRWHMVCIALCYEEGSTDARLPESPTDEQDRMYTFMLSERDEQ